jgi:hypothetical protein
MLDFIVLSSVLSLIPAYIAKGKGRPFATWFLLSMVLSPIIMLIAVLIVGKQTEVESG